MNNRLILVDDATGEHLTIATSVGGGWELLTGSSELAAWLAETAKGDPRDHGASWGNRGERTTIRLEAGG